MNDQLISLETTAPNLEEAEKIAKLILETRFASCIQFQEIKSSFFWQEKLCQEQEILISIKTTANFFERICQIIKKNHSYQTPQIIAKKIDFCEKNYFDWLISSNK
ncbi:dihydroorotate dehydrogenase [Alphaproteobacteria bacterium]|nr:dihydroorotate dehydrogenase [Alphaproteobacteria bacterium]